MKVVADVSASTEQWREVARKLGATPSDLDEMAPAFEHEAAAEARALVEQAGQDFTGPNSRSVRSADRA